MLKKDSKVVTINMKMSDYKRIKRNAEKADLTVTAFMIKVCLNAELGFVVQNRGEK